jgi:Icc-related predicted phosphoesterase
MDPVEKKDENSGSFNRRKFIDTAIKVSAVGALGYIQMSGCGDDKSEIVSSPVDKHIFLTKPYLHTLEHDSMHIRWITNKLSYSWVEYGENNLLDKKAHFVSNGLVSANTRIHEIIVQGLTPGKTYQYRVASKEILNFQPYELKFGETIYSEQFSFTCLENKNEISWIVFNDLHDRPESFPELLKVNASNHFDFAFLNGDIFDFQKDEEQIINNLITPCTNGFATKRSMLFVRGNHELRGKFARDLHNYFSFPDGHYFTYQCGPVFMIALDTGEDKEDNNPVYSGLVSSDVFREQQAIWLKKVMQTEVYKKATYRVVMMHIPPFYSRNDHATSHCKELFSPLFDEHKVDLVISGHSHVYGVHPPVDGQHRYPIIIGGGPLTGNRTLIQVKANQKQLTVQMLKDDNQVVGSYVMTAS